MRFLFRLFPHAKKELNHLSDNVSGHILAKLEHYCEMENPLRFAKPLEGEFKGFYRFRIGEYRVIFSVGKSGKVIILLILKVGHRKDVYE